MAGSSGRTKVDRHGNDRAAGTAGQRDHLDVAYEESNVNEDDVVLQHAIAALQSDTGLLRCTHGDRLLLLYGRGVAALEVAPLGAVL
jgi:hypothetical protein